MFWLTCNKIISNYALLSGGLISVIVILCSLRYSMHSLLILAIATVILFVESLATESE